MKKILAVFFLSFFFTHVIGQSPDLISYQCAIRNADGQLPVNENVTLRFSILSDSVGTEPIWQEYQSALTNSVGLVTIQLGSQNSLSGIDWSLGNKYLQVEIQNGNGYILMGTQQMLSVPYSLNSNSAQFASFAGNGIESISQINDTLQLSNGQWLIIPGISSANNSNAEIGCTNPDACNYNPNAFLDDGSCQVIGSPCNDGISIRVGDSYTIDCTCSGVINEGLNSSHTCGPENIHNSLLQYGQLVDQAGNIYKTIQIGNQNWMAENLKTTIYRNGDIVPNLSNDIAWAGLTQGGCSWYYYLPTMNCPHGLLYNSYAVVDDRDLCPTGWHIPSKSDWNKLIKHLDVSADTTCWGCYASYTAGARLKSTSLTYWANFDGLNTSNNSGFSALGSGINNNFPGFLGGFPDYSTSGLFYSKEVGSGQFLNQALSYRVRYDFNGISNEWNSVNVGLSVRCVQD
jgi:uncharacterized protein (TIGR02145 family)